MSGDGTRLCDVGTIDNTVTIVDAATMTVERTIEVGLVPYWATTSLHGDACIVSVSGDDEVAIVDYATGVVTRRTGVGRFPLRNRLGRIPEASLALLPQ